MKIISILQKKGLNKHKIETNNINFNQIDFGRLEPNSLYAVKFPDWQISTISSVIKKFNEEGKEYGIRFIPLFQGMGIVKDEENE